MLVVIKSQEESGCHVTASTKISKILPFHCIIVLKRSPLILGIEVFLKCDWIKWLFLNIRDVSISSHLPQPVVPGVYPADGPGHLRSGWAALTPTWALEMFCVDFTHTANGDVRFPSCERAVPSLENVSWAAGQNVPLRVWADKSFQCFPAPPGVLWWINIRWRPPRGFDMKAKRILF